MVVNVGTIMADPADKNPNPINKEVIELASARTIRPGIRRTKPRSATFFFADRMGPSSHKSTLNKGDKNANENKNESILFGCKGKSFNSHKS